MTEKAARTNGRENRRENDGGIGRQNEREIDGENSRQNEREKDGENSRQNERENDGGNVAGAGPGGVRPIIWPTGPENELCGRIRRILQNWLPYADLQFGEWETRPNCGYFFGGAYWYGLETAYTLSVFALLAVLPGYDEEATGISRTEVRRKAIAAIRYLGFTHDSGPDDCVRAEGRNKFCSLSKWGGREQKFFAASQTGMAVAPFGMSAWLLWADLDEETRALVQAVLAEYADRWSAEEPRNGAYFDTQTEENAWTAAGISAALALFPGHPHHTKWQEAFDAWALNAVTTAVDRFGEAGSFIGHPKKRISKVTFHPDFTTENHGFLHPSYLCAGVNIRGVHAVFCLMGGLEVPDTARYNNEKLYERTVKVWSQFDGLAVPVQGQDWWYNRQHERQLTHTLLNVVHGDRDAALLERSALAVIESIQRSNPYGCLLEADGEQCVISGYQTAKDMEHTSAKDLALSCLLHWFGGAGAAPSDADELAERLSGVYVYPFGGNVIHRTKTSFSSFSWRNHVMALTLPAHGCWSVTPLPASRIGTVKFADGLQRNVLTQVWHVLQTEKENVRVFEDGFGSAATLRRGENELAQDVAFVSLPDGASVYVERFRVLRPCELEQLETGLVGIRNERYDAIPELAPGYRTLRVGERHAERFDGFYGREANRVADYAPASWVHVGTDMGYVLFGSQGIRYVNRHEYPKWKGVEDILVLNRRGASVFEESCSLEPFVMVTLPNRNAQETEAAAGRMRLFSYVETGGMPETGAPIPDTIVLEADGRLVYVNFEEKPVVASVVRRETGGVLPLYEGLNRIESHQCGWSGRLDAFCSGFLTSEWMLFADRVESLSLDIAVQTDRLYATNRGSRETSVVVVHRSSGMRIEATVKGLTTELLGDRSGDGNAGSR